MVKIKYLGKCLIIENVKKEKIICIGDIHIGRGRGNGEAGRIIMKEIYDQTIRDFDEIFNKVKNIKKIILLGDIKNSFDIIDKDERYGIINLIDYLIKKTDKIIITKGNHDLGIENLLSKNDKIEIVQKFIFENICFFHGDKEIEGIKKSNIKTWVLGHMHPAIRLNDKEKSEMYKCFIVGRYAGRRLIIVPSFVENSVGSDILENQKNLFFQIDFSNFEVIVVYNNIKNLKFGKLKNII